MAKEYMVRGKKIKVHKPDKMQKILIIINLLLFIVGLVILLFGVACISPPLFKKLLNFMAKKGIKIPPPMIKVVQQMMADFAKLGVFVTIVGVVISIVSFTGCAGACCSKKLLKYYKYAMIVIIVVILLVGFLVHKHARTATPIIVQAMAKFFGNFNKPTARKLIHVMQMTGKCCGATSPDEWSDSTKFMNTIANRTTVGSNPVPDSCCVRPSLDCGVSNNATYKDKFDEIMAESFAKEEIEKFEQNFNNWKNEEWTDKDMQELYGSGDWEDCDPMDKACNKDFYSDDGNINFDQIKDGDFGGKDEYYETYYKNKRNAIAGRFANNVSTAPEDGIWPLGCGVKFGSLINRSRTKIPYIVLILLIPELAAIYMAAKVAKYFEEKEDLEE